MPNAQPSESSIRYSQYGVFDTTDWGKIVTGANMGTIYVTDDDLVCGFASSTSMLRHATDKLLLGLPSTLGLVHASKVDLDDALTHDQTVRIPLSSITSVELEEWTVEGRKIIVNARNQEETPVYITAGRSIQATGDRERTAALAEEIRAAVDDAESQQEKRRA